MKRFMKISQVSQNAAGKVQIDLAVSAFVPGLEMARRFYAQEIATRLQGVPHSAGRIDEGSEVLGYDTEMSADHDWGPRRLQVFVDDPVVARRRLQDIEDADLFIETPREFFRRYLDHDVDRPLAPSDWLVFSEQKLLTIASGSLFRDDLRVDAVRQDLAYYPRDVWLYQLASVWHRVGQEEHLVGRAGQAGDELGARLTAARLVRDLMRLAFLMERRYAPYPKWFGTAFQRLEAASELSPLLKAVLEADDWRARDGRLATAYEVVARRHNALGITSARPEETAPFFGRPFRVIHLLGDFAAHLVAEISDSEVRRVAERGLVGSVDVFSDSTDLVSHVHWRRTLRGLYESSPDRCG